MIDILVPVLGRPEAIRPLAENIHVTTEVEHRILFLCSQDDPATEACLATGEWVKIVEWAPERSDYPRKMQAGFDISDAEHVFLGATDITFEAGWDAQVLSAQAGVVGTNDMANGSVRCGLFSTHCLVSRRYVTEQGGSADGPGVLLHQGYDHNFVDRELCGVAMSRYEWAFAKDAIVRHRHVLWKTASDDDTYRKSLKHFHRDRQLFLRRAKLWGYKGLDGREVTLAGGGRRGRRVAI